jgi:hypothetical protein
MSFFEDASLVLIPSAIKDQKVYSVKPTDGSGDLTFSRASDATRVASDGLIEKVRTNLILQSNQFDTTWTNSNSTDTGGQAGYDGTTNAWLLESTIASGEAYLRQTISESGLKTFSIYAKAGTANFLGVYVNATSGTDPFAYFNLSTGAVGTTSATATASIVSVGSGWYRCSVAYNATIANVDVYVTTADGSFLSNTGDNIVIQASQLEDSDIATDYIATTTTAVSVGPVSGLPRLDYLNSTCPRLLLEPQRTNEVRFSEQMDNAAWTKAGVTVTANQEISPDGNMSADYVQYSAGSTELRESITSTTAGTVSVYVKGTAGETIKFGVTGDEGIYTLTGDWQRLQRTFAGTSAAITINTYSGATARNIYVWGAQVEVGTYATSYIPTLGTSVTRVKDNCDKTGVSSLIGQTEGTVFVEFKMNGQSLSEDVYSNNKNLTGSISIQTTVSGQLLGFICYAGTFIQFASSTGVIQIGQTYKVAIGYKTGNSAIYLNGAQIAASSTAFAFTTTLDEIDIANNAVFFASQNNKLISQVLQFKTRLTNAQLAELTTL